MLLLSGQGILRTAGKGKLLAGLLGAELLGLVMLLGGGEGIEKISDDIVTTGVNEVMTDTGSFFFVCLFFVFVCFLFFVLVCCVLVFFCDFFFSLSFLALFCIDVSF